VTPPPATARTAWWHAVLVAVLCAGLVAVPDGVGHAAGEVVVLVLGTLAVRVAVSVHRAAAAWALRVLGASLLCFGASSTAESAGLAGIAPGLTAVLEPAFDLGGYAALLVAALVVLSTGAQHGSREVWVDRVTLLLATGLAVTAFAHSGVGSGVVGELGIGAPLLAALVLLVCIPLAVPHERRTVSSTALLVAGALTVLGYGGRIVAPVETPLVDELPLLAVAVVVLAARHPSVATLGRRAEGREATPAGRVVGLGAALLMTPALVVLWAFHHGAVGYVLGGGSALLTGLALWRLERLTRERETVRRALAASQARLHAVLEHAADVVAIIGVDGTVAYVSPAVETLLGAPPAAYVGLPAADLADPRDRARLQAAVTAAGTARAGGQPVDVDVRLLHASGGSRWVEVRVSGRVDVEGVEGWVANLREVTDRRLFEEELRRQARTDPLTGLHNRTSFWELLSAGVVEPDPPAVLYVDLDGFKAVNDSLGHAAGDELLRVVGARLTAAVRAADVVARIGGDEFAVLLPGADAALLDQVAARVVRVLRDPVHVAGGTAAVTASVGGATALPGDTAEELLHRADTAMYDAKRSGKDGRALAVPGPRPAGPRRRATDAPPVTDAPTVTDAGAAAPA
jgi:diguanylate cyclase (GGDEF)-like protein/PAS domain S-box-containing protein